MNTPSKFEKFKTLFEEQKANLVYSTKLDREMIAVKSEELADEMDLTSAELEQDMLLRLKSREALFMKKINEALHKIHAGTFGICEECEEDIELSRLEVRPTASLCITCKESQEARESRSADGLKPKSVGKAPHLRSA